MDAEQKFYVAQTRNVMAGIVVFFACCFYACDRSQTRDNELRAALPLVTTCTTHSPIDAVRGGRGQ